MTDGTDDGRLFEWYRAYIGEPDREIDVYLGFALFFAGIGLGIAAFVIGAAGQLTGAGGQSADFVYREAAIAAGMLALPTTLSSVVVLLPVSKRAVYGAVAGDTVALVALGLFVWAYPYDWAVGQETYSIQVLALYGVGLAALLAATGGALVAYHIEKARPSPGDFADEGGEESGEEITDEEIQEDIESAMSEVDLTWGGVERETGSDLKINSSEIETDAEISGMNVEADRVKRSSVDEQVAGLAMVKGGQKQTDTSESTVDDQIDQLSKLREQKRKEAETEEEETVLQRLLARVAAMLGRT